MKSATQNDELKEGVFSSSFSVLRSDFFLPVHLVEVQAERLGEGDVAQVEDGVARVLDLDELKDAVLSRRRAVAVARFEVTLRVLRCRALVARVVAERVNDVRLQ